MTEDEVRAMTDEDFQNLMARFRGGDHVAYEQVFLYLNGKLSRIVSPTLRIKYARVGSKADSEDILHDVLCRMIPYLMKEGDHACQGVMHFHRLAGRVLRHTLIDLNRKHFGPVLGRPLADHADDLVPGLRRSSGMDRLRDRLSVHELIDKLDADDRTVIELALYSNLKNADLARCLGISEGHASRLMSRAKEHLGRLIEEDRVSD